MYAKLFSSVLDSSLMDEDITTRLTFLLMLAAADRDGRINLADQSLARRLNIPIEDLRRSLERLTHPDPDSRTKDDDGRRLVRDESGTGYRIPNYGRFRDTRSEDDQRALWREQKRQQRATPAECPPNVLDILGQVPECPQVSASVLDILGQVPECPQVSASVLDILGQSAMSYHTDTDTDTDTDNPPLPPKGGVDSPSFSAQGSKDSDQPDFTEFWDRYPRKEAKPAARKAWKSLKASQKAAALADDPKARYAETEAPYIPHPATYLRQERYLDPPPPKLNGTTVKKPLRGVNHGMICAQQALEIQPNNDMDRLYAEALAYDAMIAAEAAKEAESAAVADQPEPATVP